MNGHGICACRSRKNKQTAVKLVAITLCFLSPLAFGQAKATPHAKAGAKARTDTISLNVEEVSIDLVVRDKQHRSILDLKPGDIAISDNGTPVKLNNLHLVSADSSKGNLTTLVFDPMQGAAAHNAQEIANKIIAMLPRKGFNVAILTLGSRLRLVQGFTDDKKAQGDSVEVATQESESNQNVVIAAAEHNLTAVLQSGVDTTGKLVSAKARALAQVQMSALEGSQRVVQDEHTQPSLAGLLALSRAEQELEERKTIIYFALNGEMDQDANPMVNTIREAAGRANVAIYTVDMTGVGAQTREQLMTMNAMGPHNGVNPLPTSGSPGGGLPHGMPGAADPNGPLPTAPNGTPIPRNGDPIGPGGGTEIATFSAELAAEGVGNGVASNSPLGALSALTGGIYIDGQDSVKRPLEQMLQDMTTYYQASYVPPEQEYDGSFRPIAVKSLRPGVFVHAKAGYYALASGGADGIRPFEAPLMKILSEPKLPAEKNFHASILRLGDMTFGNSNSLVIELPLSSVELREEKEAGQYSAHVSIVAQIKDRDGTVIDHFAEDIPRHGALDSVADARKEFITLQRHFMAIPGDYQLEAAVMDRNSGEAGAQRINFKIPEPQAGPSLSDVALVRKLSAFDIATDPQEPLVYDAGKVIPNLSGQVSLSEEPISLFFVLHPDSKSSEPAKLDMDVFRDGSRAGHTPLTMPNDSGAIPFLAVLRAGTLPPGLYDVTARMTQGSKKAESTISFSVVGNQPAGAALAAGDAAAKLGAVPRKAGLLAFAVPATPLPAPSWQDFDSILADAGERAVAYSDSLPDLLCVEATDRSAAPDTMSEWKHTDSITEMLSYRDKSEAWALSQVNGEPATGDPKELSSAQSYGEFGGLFKAVFQPSSKADFKWKEAEMLGADTVQVFSYRVTADNSDFIVPGAGKDQITSGFRGQVFIDSATHDVRRITLTADGLPSGFPIHSSSILVDYGHITIDSHDYLLPVAGEVRTIKSDHSTTMSQMEFRDYKPYNSKAITVEQAPVTKP